MKNFKSFIAGAILMTAAAITSPAIAQLDEIIVTGSRIANDNNPGVFLEKRGDFLLLEARLINDTRDAKLRQKEMHKTFEKILAAAKTNSDIQLSIVDENDLVAPLTKEVFEANVRFGPRADTSQATILLKTEIPETVTNAFALLTKLENFVDDIQGEGRSEFIATDETSISVINPNQYRKDVINLIVAEVNLITNGLSGEYGARIEGINQDLRWARSGELNLAFYIPYTYDILPSTLSNLTIINTEDY